MVTLVEPHVQRLLARYDLTVSDTFMTEERLRDRLAKRVLPPDLTSHFQAARARLRESLDSITGGLRQLDPTLVEAAERSGAKMRHQLDRLQTRAAYAELRRNEILVRHAALLRSALYPGGNLQERTIGGIYFLARHPNLLQQLHDAASPACHELQVLATD
jgi:uncharacterized protein YllA (UPF0747 family)